MIIVIKKVKNPILGDELYITINYQHIYKIKPANYFNLAFKYYNFVSKLYYTIYSCNAKII